MSRNPDEVISTQPASTTAAELDLHDVRIPYPGESLGRFATTRINPRPGISTRRDQHRITVLNVNQIHRSGGRPPPIRQEGCSSNYRNQRQTRPRRNHRSIPLQPTTFAPADDRVQIEPRRTQGRPGLG